MITITVRYEVYSFLVRDGWNGFWIRSGTVPGTITLVQDAGDAADAEDAGDAEKWD